MIIVMHKKIYHLFMSYSTMEYK